MRGRKALANGVERGPRPPVVDPDPGEDAHALRLDEDLALDVLGRPDRPAEEVVGPPEPGAVPSVLVDRRAHLDGRGTASGRLRGIATHRGDRGELAGGQHEEGGDEDRFGDPAAAVLGRLERFAGRLREAVQVEAVVPVSAADEGKPLRAQAIERVLDRALEVLVERSLGARLVVEWKPLVEDRRVAGLLQVGRDGENQPGRVIVEPGADIEVAALRERLVLVVRAAGRQLGRGDVEKSLAGPGGDHLDESEEVLARVPEPDPATDPRFEERRRARDVERDHALVRVPDVDHPVDVLVARPRLVRPDEVGPARAQRLERCLDRGRLEVASDRRPDAPLVDPLGARWIELRVRGVLGVAQDELDLPRLAGPDLEANMVRA